MKVIAVPNRRKKSQAGNGWSGASETFLLGIVRMLDEPSNRFRQARDVDDHLLVMHVDDGRDRQAVVATVLDVDEKLVPSSRADITDGAEFLLAALGVDLEADGD